MHALTTCSTGGFSNYDASLGKYSGPAEIVASLFMFLVVSMLNTYGLGAGVRLIMTGAIIITVILLASGRKPTLR